MELRKHSQLQITRDTPALSVYACVSRNGEIYEIASSIYEAAKHLRLEVAGAPNSSRASSREKKQETSGARATRTLAHRCTQEAEQEEKNETEIVSSLVEDFAMVALQRDDGRVETELVRFLERFKNRRAARTSVASFAGFRMNYRGINVARTSNAPPPYDLRRTIPFSDLAGFPFLHSSLENRIS